MKTRAIADSVFGPTSLPLLTALFLTAPLMATAGLSGCTPQSGVFGPAFVMEAELDASHLDYTRFSLGWYEYADLMQGEGYVRARTTPDPPYAGVPTKFEMRLATTPQWQVTRVFVRTLAADSEYVAARPVQDPPWQEARIIQRPDLAEEGVPPSGQLREFLYLHSVSETTYEATLDIPEGQQILEFKLEMADGSSAIYPGWPLVSHRRVATAVVPF
jgi:hypothetical protein